MLLPCRRDYLWRTGEDEKEPGPADVPLDALPLPDAIPAGEPLPPEAVAALRDSNWLAPQKPVTDIGDMLGMPGAVGLRLTRHPQTGLMEQEYILRGE